MFKWFKKRELERIKAYTENRKVTKYKLTIYIDNGDIVVGNTEWLRSSMFKDGIESYKRFYIMNEKTVTINETTYSTNHIVKIEHEIISIGLVKSESFIKYSNSGSFAPRKMKISFASDEVEEI